MAEILVPVITKEVKALVGKQLIVDDFGHTTTRGVLHVFCAHHEVYFDCRQGECLRCYEERTKSK